LLKFDKVRISAANVFKSLAKKGILLRKMDVYGIKNSLRVTIGTSKENKKLISELKKLI
jgi:histidinol-phosphate aminotransferase